MKNNKLYKYRYLLVLIFLFGSFLILKEIKKRNNVKLKINEIKEKFEGVIVEKFSVRNTPPTHLRIKNEYGFIEISPNQEIVLKANTGDSIIKMENENFVYLITKQGAKTKYFYTRLSNETRNSKYFPKEWKKLWYESSKWDND
ncbi:hypothetical protein [Flavivirga eckloniae]|uniref:Uncharacterized protein n=1 Tax=Flavivirga eckloniae TaxID=1803846 RepID=A0A2K9PK68_9FLAO|nr:hypothetical protein [Flavivirga eckloniae]AUP77425.1 hypothetical protein C1H87_01295 [Flavivirga eckloniae]